MWSGLNVTKCNTTQILHSLFPCAVAAEVIASAVRVLHLQLTLCFHGICPDLHACLGTLPG